MSLSYNKLRQQRHNMVQLTRVTPEEFDRIVRLVEPLWQEAVETKKKCLGRTSHLPTLADKILCALVYYRTYITHNFLSYLFNLHNSNICRERWYQITGQKVS